VLERPVDRQDGRNGERESVQTYHNVTVSTAKVQSVRSDGSLITKDARNRYRRRWPCAIFNQIG